MTLLVDPGKDELSALARQNLGAAGVQALSGEVRRVTLSGQDIGGVVLKGGRVLQAKLIFSPYGSDPNIALLRSLPVELTERGMVNINEKGQTSLERFYAAGDVTNYHSDQVASAVHGGAQAAQAANYVLYPARQALKT